MKKIIFLILSFSFIFAGNVVCAKRIESKGVEDHYYKICIEGQEYVSLNYNSKYGVMAATGKKCQCIFYKEKTFLGTFDKYKFKEIK